MATPNYEQIRSFGNVSEQLRQAAIDEFMERINDTMTLDEIIEQASEVAYQFSMYGAELGAQWYDLCTELAGIDAEPANVSDPDAQGIAQRATAAAESGGDAKSVFNSFLQAEINASIRKTGSDNMWRDYERGIAPGRWARVPNGNACAWCYMLASQGGWYGSKKAASANFHDNCTCTVVYHATPESIQGYQKQLESYKRMYYDADNARIANANGKEPYPKELKQRVDTAKKQHAEREKKRAEEAAERGEKYKKVPWQTANETSIVMRYQHPGMH